MIFIYLLVILLILQVCYAFVALVTNDNDWLAHLTEKIVKYWFEPIEKDLLDIKPASFVDSDGERVYVTSDREVFYGYYPAKEHEEDILLKMYLDYGLIDKRTAGKRIERKSQNMTWEQLSEKSGVPMGSIVYAFIEKYPTFHVRLNLDEMIKLCVALDMYIATVPVWVFGCGVSFGRKDK